MHKKTLLATLILGLLASQAVAAPYLPLASDHRNGEVQTASNAWLEVDLGASSTTSRPSRIASVTRAPRSAPS